MRFKNYILLASILFLLPSFLSWDVEEVPEDFCFDFDEVDYYHTDIDEYYDEDPNYMPDENVDRVGYDKAQEFDKILSDSYPLTLKDSSFFIALSNSDYKLEKIKRTRHQELKHQFCSSKNADKEVYLCLPLYRDILVFKNKNKVVGLSKICFTCDQIYLLNKNDIPFGLWFDLDLEKLRLFLNSVKTK